MGCRYLFLLLSSSMSLFLFFFFQAEDGIRDLVRSRGLGDVYKRQLLFRFIYGTSTHFAFPRCPSEKSGGTGYPH